MTEGDFLVGFGQDSHHIGDEFEKQLKIGGVSCPGIRIQANSSDGDLLYHCVFNAISSALGTGSIGDFFPEYDQKNNIDSEKFFDFLFPIMEKRGLKVSSLSISVECAKPRIGPIAPQIKANLARIFSLPEERIGVTATSGEQLTAFGLGKGIRVFSVAVLRSK